MNNKAWLIVIVFSLSFLVGIVKANPYPPGDPREGPGPLINIPRLLPVLGLIVCCFVFAFVLDYLFKVKAKEAAAPEIKE